MNQNPYSDRLAEVRDAAAQQQLDVVILENEFNRLSLTGVQCDNGVLVIGKKLNFYTDFRYTVMAQRVAPWLKTLDLWPRSKEAQGVKAAVKAAGVKSPKRIGYEGSSSAKWYLMLKAAFPQAELVDFEQAVLNARAVKTVDEIARLAAAEALNDRIWAEARRLIRPGMTEKTIQRVIRALMNEYGDGEAFETIACAGANAAECHHVPDDTVWHRGEPLLVDMGVKINGVCSDMTRNIVPRNPDPEYAKIYNIVLEANLAGIAAARPGITGGELDEVARSLIRKAGYGDNFGHSLGHGVGFQIHEAPWAAAKCKMVLRPGMLVTIEPGIYLPGKLGVRIEDLVLITAKGCEVLSSSPKRLPARRSR